MDETFLLQGLEALQRAVHLPEGVRQREFLKWLQDFVPTYQPSPLGLGIYASLDAPVHQDVATLVQ